ncbi:MAG: NAD-dependent deacylase [Dehalococcoidia bacterium]|nr:NAD-dependent deacylase [Dehalococcoidia bacterium]
MTSTSDLITRAARQLLRSRYAIALTGAGMSTESGIPDFRGPSGVWTRDPDAEKRAYRGYDRLLADPAAWWRERSSAPGVLGDLANAMPNAGHYSLAELEEMGLLKCVLTQNVDGLHEKAGTFSMLEYHGSVFKLRCMECNSRFSTLDYDLEQLAREGALPPRCSECSGVVKPDTVSFGEPIPGDVARASDAEARKCDLMLICGTSAVVYPFAELPRLARSRGKAVSIIEINAEPTPLTEEGISDYLIRGKTGELLPRLVEEVKRLKGAASEG